MAARGEIEGTREHLADGHLIQYSARFHNLLVNMPITFERSFEFNCKELPTSWTFRANFMVKPEDGSLFCTVVVRRNDYSSVMVEGVFWMKLFAAPIGDIPAINFVMSRMRSRREANKTFDGIVQDVDRRRIDERGVVVQVSFNVHGCHKDRDLKRLIIRRNLKENMGDSFNVLFSKM